jgi:hypothetical protein
MTGHWNIQINIQRVDKIAPAPLTRGYGTQPDPSEKRQVVSVLELKITADTEAEAYAKAHRMLIANESEPEVDLSSPSIALPLPRSGRPIRDAPQA